MNDRCFYDPARFNISGAPAGSITPDPDINPAKYYVGLKAINRAGLEAIKWSDQMTIDTEPPQLQSLDFMRNGDNVTVISSQNISLAWAAGDSVSGILFYDFALGTTPFSNDLYAWTRTNATGANFTTTAPLPAEGGRVCVSLNATDGALNMNSTVTCATVQTHPPDNASASVRLQMHGRQIAWTGFIESATSIAYYEVSVSSGNSGAPDVLPWTAISFSDRVESAIIFGPNASYLLPTNKRTILSPLFYRVRATNLGSLSSEVSTRAAYYLGTDSMLLAPRENNSAMIKGFQDETIGLSVATLLPATSEHAILVVPLTANVGYVPDSFGGLPLPPPLLVLRAGGKYGRYKRAEAAILSVTKDGNINSGSFVVVNGTFTSNDNATDVKSFAVYGVRVTGGQWVGVKSIANSAQRSLNFTATFGGMYALYVNETVPTFVDLNLDGLPDILYTQDSPSHRLRRKEEEAEEVSTIDDPAETTVKRQKRAPVSFVPTTYGYWPSTSYLMNATFQSPTLTSTMTIVSLW
ncbi:uncharacterized protein EV422DRAFT_160681 [Fimicolochytrium jonesii]|uniref:uncharacterized protein n=1 Tax=Fimicolochytrium jonesii TaxID=1396493 RepID=UPI0022FE2995|nr:uncharacterized protein EV422DRAFT_160681 [Fimicolochytrium jonesii]KAI8826278.1 hypothetical protein EV422DRAFT_160681 [Fimicolochytrium jonesii]